MNKILMFFVVTMMLASSAAYAGTNVTSVTYPVNDTFTETNSSILVGFNITGDAETYGCNVTVNGTVAWTLPEQECLQETANVSPGCGGLDDVSLSNYSFDENADFDDPEHLYDGDYATSTTSTNETADNKFLINLTIPDYADAPTWNVTTNGTGSFVYTEVEVPMSCLELYGDVLVLEIELIVNNTGGANETNIGCYNTTGEDPEVLATIDNDTVIVDENIKWEIRIINDTAYNATVVADFSDGLQHYNVTCWDEDDVATTSGLYQFTVDATAIADMAFVSPTEDNDTAYEYDYYYVNMTFTEDNPDTCILSENGTDHVMTMVGTSYCYLNRTGLSDGIYNYNVTLNDTFGNTGVSENRVITLDSVYPADLAFVAPTLADAAMGANDYFYVNMTFTEDNPWLCNFLGNVSGTPTSQLMTVVGTSYCYYNFTAVPDGLVEYNVWMSDLAGATTISEHRSLTIDSTTPSNITFVAPTEADAATVTQTSYYVNVTFTEANPDTCILEENGTNHTMTLVGRTHCYISRTGLGAGEYNYTVYLNDTMGNVNASSERSVNLAAAAAAVTGTINATKAFGEIPAGAILGLTENVSVGAVIQLVVIMTVIGFGMFAHTRIKTKGLKN